MDPLPELLYPLTEFDQTDLASGLEAVEPQHMPDPYRRLLDHENDMTPTLETFHRAPIALHVLAKRTDAQILYRQVLLVCAPDGRVVELGAIRIDLSLFAPVPQRQILDSLRPLGAILRDHAIPHLSRPVAFFRLHPGAVIAGALRVGPADLLYGRRAALLDGRGATVADIVEILPPAEPTNL